MKMVKDAPNIAVGMLIIIMLAVGLIFYQFSYVMIIGFDNFMFLG